LKPNEKAFFEKLSDIMKKQYQTEITEEQMNITIPGIGLHENALTAELVFRDENCGIEDGSAGILQIFISICRHQPNQEALFKEKIVELNHQLMVGAFHVYVPLTHVYYAYDVILPDMNTEYSVLSVMIALMKMTENLGYLYDYLIIIGSDAEAMTLTQYEEEMENARLLMEENPELFEEIRRQGTE